MIYSLIRCLFI